MTNKEKTISFLKALVVFIYLSLTIGTVATALNSKPNTFFTIVSVALLACNLALCIRAILKIANKP